MLFRSWNLGGRGVERVLGPLESRVMRVVWDNGAPMSARDICDAIQPTRRNRAEERALTTVVTTIERLHKKGILERTGSRGEYVYRATMTQKQFEKKLVKHVMDGLMQDFEAPALSYLAQRLDIDADEQNALDAEVERRKKKKREDKN